MSKVIDGIIAKAQAGYKCIVLAEGEDERVVRAAVEITKRKIAKIVLLGDEQDIRAKHKDLNFDGIKIINPQTSELRSKYSALLFELRKAKGMTEEEAYKLAGANLYFGVLMIKAGDADGMVGGACHSTGDVLRPALQIIKTKPGISSVSGAFLMALPDNSPFGQNGVMVFGDCAVIPDPSAEQLAAIAVASAETARKLGDVEPKVAMLSYSTKGSAKSEMVDKVAIATKLAHEIAPDLELDGELQVDAALVQSVADLKAPGSKVAGHANVFVFPDLNAGNIGYKLVQRFGGVQAIGPICQGLAKPVNDLSRGCSVDDIVVGVAITSVLDM